MQKYVIRYEMSSRTQFQQNLLGIGGYQTKTILKNEDNKTNLDGRIF